MSNQTPELIPSDDLESSTECLSEGDAPETGPDSALAVGGEVDETDSPPGITCEHCGEVRRDTSTPWCGHCGFHPSMGCCVELCDTDREKSEEEKEKTAEQPSAAAGLACMFRAIPSWVWKIGVGLAIVAVISLAPRYFTSPGTSARTTWALSQLVITISMVGAAHVMSFLHALPEGEKLGIMDLLLSPMSVWGSTIRDMRATGAGWYRAGLLSWGTLGKIITLTVVGGIPYDMMWDWGIEEPPKNNLIGAVADAARAGSPDTDGLADAVDNVDESAESLKETPKPVEKKQKRRETVDCLVIGYTYRSIDGKAINALLLATEIKGKLRYVGKVEQGFTVDELDDIHTRLKQIPRPRPLVACGVAAKWVQPVVTCRVSCTDFRKSKRLSDTKFEKLLGEIKLLR